LPGRTGPFSRSLPDLRRDHRSAPYPDLLAPVTSARHGIAPLPSISHRDLGPGTPCNPVNGYVNGYQ